jgi:hypothetical protein
LLGPQRQMKAARTIKPVMALTRYNATRMPPWGRLAPRPAQRLDAARTPGLHHWRQVHARPGHEPRLAVPIQHQSLRASLFMCLCTGSSQYDRTPAPRGPGLGQASEHPNEVSDATPRLPAFTHHRHHAPPCSGRRYPFNIFLPVARLGLVTRCVSPLSSAAAHLDIGWGRGGLHPPPSLGLVAFSPLLTPPAGPHQAGLAGHWASDPPGWRPRQRRRIRPWLHPLEAIKDAKNDVLGTGHPAHLDAPPMRRPLIRPPVQPTVCIRPLAV